MSERATPRMTFSSMCEYLKASPVRQISILREQKYPDDGPMLSYVSAMQQIVSFAVSGTPLDPYADGLRPHEQEVITELVANAWTCPAPQATRPSTQQPGMMIQGVEISFQPDLILMDPTGKKPTSGAMKFYLSKSKELDCQVGVWMASLLYQYRLNVTNDPNTNADLCMIYDVRKDEHHSAGKSHKKLFQNIESACQIISAMWPRV